MLGSRSLGAAHDLLPIIRHFNLFEGSLPDQVMVDDQLMPETGFICFLLAGNWLIETRPGEWVSAPRALFLGGSSRPLPIRIRGDFKAVGMGIRPSAWRMLFDDPAEAWINRSVALAQIWGKGWADLDTAVRAACDDATIIAAIEGALRARLVLRGGRTLIDPVIAQFETIARHDSMIRVDAAARQLGLSVRQFERRCHASWGLSPKMILRRSRFLDIATAMRGLVSPDDQQLAALRYFDQSHLTREFRFFVDMTPRRFLLSATPLFSAGLKLRAAGKARG